jgi:fructose-specific PTS system IIA-like component
LEIAANIATAEEAEIAFKSGAEGIGLFRTEMLFFDREAAPDEEEQYQAYRRVIEIASGRPVLIRTLDIGGDKPLAYLNLPVEENPFLGHRAVRIYPELEALFRTQIRALVRASAHGPVKVMLPMVAVVDEVRWAKKIIADEQARCARAGLNFDRGMPVGAMIEVTSAAFALDQLSAELDFFSIGSNDLLQYFLAVDRANVRVAGLYNPLQPSFLRFLKQIVDAVHEHKRWIGLCGEIGGQPRFLPLLVGLGLDEVSTAPPCIPALKAKLAGLAHKDCQALFQAAAACASAEDVGQVLDAFSAEHEEPLFAPELIALQSDAATKAEAIKQAVDVLYMRGRIEEPRTVEQAIWEREATYTTGFGYGFAIPHCKSRGVLSNSLVVLKPSTPIAWDSLDGDPIRLMILLAIRECDSATEHMKVFSKLARLMMHEDFRAEFEGQKDESALCEWLSGRLEL